MSQISGSIDYLPIRLKRILFASNFTETSAMALPYAAAFARRFGAEICAMHVIAPEEVEHIEPAQLDATLRQMKADAEKRIRGLLSAAQFDEIPYRILLAHGDVREAIAAQVRENQIDMIVAGSHGRHGVRKLLSPSIDEAIARGVACPVLLVGPEVTVPPEAEVRIARILLATDFQSKSKPVMDYAYSLAAAYKAEIYVLHVADDVWREPLSTRMTAEAFCRMRLLEKGLPEHAHGIEPKFLVEFGSPESLILETAQKIGAQLIVAGLPATAHAGLSSHLPGPMAYDVASHAVCPVLAIGNAADASVLGKMNAAG
jgi:nucleotide-binding universal stress UspA family protein